MSRYLPVANPQNRFSSTTMEYDDPDVNPGAPLEVYEDRSRSILASNDSPDVGFKWSVNPYRGCFHGCAYCLDGDTRVLMADGRTRALRDLRVGDDIYGTEVRGQRRRYVKTKVLAHWQTLKPAHRVRLADGTQLVASPEHRFLTSAGWKHVAGSETSLAAGDRLVGFGAVGPAAPPSPATLAYQRGYLTGLIRGCGLVRGPGLRTSEPAATATARAGDHFRLALTDLAPLRRARAYLASVDVSVSDEFVYAEASGDRERVMGIRSQASAGVARIEALVAWPGPRPSREWQRGLLAGAFDGCGSFVRGVLRIDVVSPQLLDATDAAFRALGLEAVRERARDDGTPCLRLEGGMRDALAFFQSTDPASTRKRDVSGFALAARPALAVLGVDALGYDSVMFDITTGTGDFLANGVVSHNCYARPTHEYLSLGAGSDFERKIIVKRNAAELLREAFEKPSWKGEHIVFSGITDCYQPLEAKLGITRELLEVCREYKNPVGIITKSPVIERDAELLAELARIAACRVSISIPFWDADVARAVEPYVTTPERRMKIIETLAKAGVRVGVSVSPIIPGLNDEHLGDVLARARDAGASHAFYVLLRLPGAVKNVFETSLRKNLPLRAEKVLRRMREAHGGKLYDSSFGTRGSGSGVYADTIAALFVRLAKKNGLRPDEMDERWDHADTFERPPRAPAPAKNGQTSFGF